MFLEEITAEALDCHNAGCGWSGNEIRLKQRPPQEMERTKQNLRPKTETLLERNNETSKMLVVVQVLYLLRWLCHKTVSITSSVLHKVKFTQS